MDEEIKNDFTGLNYYGGTIPGNVLPMTATPFGFSVALARNNGDGMNGNMLTETEKEHLIFKCKDAASDEEAEKILQKLEPDVSAQLLQEEATVYGPLENTNALY